MRSVSPPPPRTSRWGPARTSDDRSQQQPEPDARRDDRSATRPSERRSERQRSATPPRQPKQRDRTPPPQMRKWGVPAPDSTEQPEPVRGERKSDRGRSPDRRQEDRQRSATPPPRKPEKREAASFDRDNAADSRSLMSRLGGQRDRSPPPPAKRSKREDDLSREDRRQVKREDDDRMDVDESRNRNGHRQDRRGKSATPPPARGISILGAGKARARASDSARAPKDEDDDAPIVDITENLKLDDEAIAKANDSGKSSGLMRLYNPGKGTSLDAGAYMALVKDQNTRTHSPAADSGKGEEPKRSRTASTVIPAFAGLPARPRTSEATFSSARNMSDGGSHELSRHPDIDSYRPSNDRRDSRDAYRPARRPRSRSPPPGRRVRGLIMQRIHMAESLLTESTEINIAQRSR